MPIYQLTNLISNGSFEKDSDWIGITYDNTQSKFGNRSQRLDTGGTYVGQSTMISPIVGHVYYGRHYIKTNGNANPVDCRFEWYGGDGEGLNFVFGWNRGNHPDWYMESTLMQITVVNGTSYTCRSFVVNSDYTVWADGLMIVDLTQGFGAGNEPTKEWCDENIPFFDGKINIIKPSQIIFDLVTDRTQQDVDRVKELKQKIMSNGGVSALTQEEQAEYFNTIVKGAYNYTDLNRVGEACTYLYNVFVENGYIVDGYTALRTDWTISDIPTLNDMQTYINTLQALKNVYNLSQTIPNSMSRLNFENANNIEKLLVKLDEALSNMQSVFIKSNMPFAYSDIGYYFENL